MRFDTVTFETSFGTEKQLTPSTLPEVVFAGRSNVGKSSLLNKLFGRKSLARVSAKPGKTVTINFFMGDGVRFVDLPGYGYAKASHSEKQRWSRLLEAYFRSNRSIALVVQLVDMRHAPSAQDYEMLRYLSECGFPFVIVLTKCDKLKPMERKRRIEEIEQELSDFPDVKRIIFSAETGEGLEQLRETIAAVSEQANHSEV